MQFASLKNIQFTSERTQKAIDLAKMGQKSYESVEKFEDDIKWFQHNLRTNFSYVSQIQKASKRLIGFMEQHIQFIEMISCDECYGNAHEYETKFIITKPCSKPHLLLWVKVRGYCYWPAKVMTLSIDNKKINVQFFGDYSGSYLSVNNCFVYSKENPEKTKGPPSEEYIKAINVRILYVT